MVSLPNVTLVCVDTHYYGEAIAAIRQSLNQIKPAKALFLTDIKAYNPKFPFEIVKIDKLDGKKAYSEFIIKELDKYFDTDFVLIIQHDGWVLNGDAWLDEFTEYDYSGASWLETDGYAVGNGGFSFRSKRLQHILATDELIQPYHPEDATICRLYRPYLEEKYGIKFASTELADKFSFELREPICNTFGFHGKFHKPYTETVVVKRSAALGDIVALEPLLEYYHKKGLKVAIDIPLGLAMIYAKHHFTVHHISQIDMGRIPYRLIDLDMAYEKNPKQLHLKSYYDAAGITDGEIKNPKLNFPIDNSNRLFKRYCVIHIDNRDQAYRNIYGIEWKRIVSCIKSKGIDVIQIGLSDHQEIEGALYMNTPTTNFLLYLIAGAELFVGVDSGPSNIAVACNVKSVVFHGSVNPDCIYPDQSNMRIITNHNHEKPICNKPYCWHESITTTGQDCYISKEAPPCTQYSEQRVIEALKDFIA